MSESDVRKQYPAEFQKKSLENGEFELVDRGQKLLDQPASAELFFDKGGRLEQISLSMNPIAADIDDAHAAGSSLAVIDVINKKLVEKYGEATSIDGKCAVTAEGFVSSPIFTCHSLWRSAGETVELFWVVKKMRISDLGLVYKPLPGDI